MDVTDSELCDDLLGFMHCPDLLKPLLPVYETFTLLQTQISLSVCVSVCVQNTSFCQSAAGYIKSHLVTAVVLISRGEL